MSSIKYVLIMHNWNMYIVPHEAKEKRPVSKFLNIDKYDTSNEDFWFDQTEHYYATPELLEEWGFEHGWGVRSGDVNVNDLVMGRDFDTVVKDTIHHVKIARGAETESFKNHRCAIPVTKK